MDETLHVVAAQRLRMMAGARRLSQLSLCQLCGWNRGYMNRRWTGETPLSINDIHTLEIKADIPIHYLLTGEFDCLAIECRDFDQHDEETRAV